MIINATSHTIRNIWIIFLFIILFIVIFIGTLIHGVSIDSLTLPKLKIERLYIKLDKKFIVTIENVDIEKSNSADSSLEESVSLLQNLPYFHQFFSEIDIKKITYDNEVFYVNYTETLFAFDSKHLAIKAHITPLEALKFDIEIEDAHLKDLSLHLSGLLHNNVKDQLFRFDGKFDLYGIYANASITLDKKLITYMVTGAAPFTNKELTNLMNYIASQVELEPIVKSWIHEYIVAKEYTLHDLTGKYDLRTDDFFPLQMKAHATVKDANISFNPKVPPAHADQIGIKLEKDTLSFDITNPIYETKSLKKADVYIYKLLTKGTGIVVDLNTKARLDASIHKILTAFGINVPLTQTSGITDASVKLDIKFLPFDINATGEFKVAPSQFMLSALPMTTRGGVVDLNNLVIKLNQTNLQYKNLFDIDTTGVLDTNTGKYTGKVDINSLLVDFQGTTLLKTKKIPDQNGSFTIDGNATTIELPGLKTRMQFGKNSNLFDMPDLSVFQPHSPLMKDFNITKGALKLSTKDFEKFDATINLPEVKTPFLENNQSINAVDITLNTNGSIIDASALNKRVIVHFDKEMNVNISDLNISVPDDNGSSSSPIKITINGKNSSFIDQNSSRVILSDTYKLVLNKDQTLLRSSKRQSTFNYDKSAKQMILSATAMDDNITNTLFTKNYFNQGNFSLDMEGKNLKEYSGTFIMHKTYIKELQFFNNLMATINALPSLVVFHDPSFNKLGYFVEDGFIEFSQKDNKMIIKELQLKGNTADITGKGVVDFENDKLDLHIQIKTLKTFSSAIDMIPLVRGVILGDDKKISTNVDITGSLDNPKIETHLFLDTLKSPVNIIKRTIELPLELIK